jgi:hypothetical protein
MAAIARFLDDYLHNLKDKRLELKRDEESYGNSPSEDDLGYLVEKYKASLDYFIQDLQAAVDRLPHNNAGAQGQGIQANANNNPSSQSNLSVNNASNNPRGGKRKHKNKTKKHR